MPPQVIDLRQSDDSRDVIHRAVQALAENQLVAFPSETEYLLAASALSAPAVERLEAAVGPSAAPLLVLKSADEALDYLPGLSPLAQRLARRCWPGPVALSLPDSHSDSLLNQLPAAVRQWLRGDGWLRTIVPAHPVLADVLRMMAGPVVVCPARRVGDPLPLTAPDVIQNLGDAVQLVVDDGRSRYGQELSIVRVSPRGLEVLQAGVVPVAHLQRLASLMILFVCTGNTCRSPMAEALCRQLIAQRLGCGVDELPQNGVVVMSAGVAAMLGGRASPEAVRVMCGSGVDLDRHESQPVTSQLVKHADYILAMTRSHRQAILSEWPEAADRTHLLCHDRNDIPDPIGGPLELYQQCADRMRQELLGWIDRWNLGSGKAGKG